MDQNERQIAATKFFSGNVPGGFAELAKGAALIAAISVAQGALRAGQTKVSQSPGDVQFSPVRGDGFQRGATLRATVGLGDLTFALDRERRNSGYDLIRGSQR